MAPHKEENVNDHDESANIVKSSRPPVQYPNLSFAQFLFSELNAHDQNIVALTDSVDESYQVTYGELQTHSRQFASALLQLGLEKGDFVSFYSENSVQYVIAMLGTIYLGLPFCHVPPTSGPFELTEQMRITGTTILIYGNDKAPVVIKAANDEHYADTLRQLNVVVQLEAKQNAIQQLVSHPIFEDTKVHSFEQLTKANFPAKQLNSIPHFPVQDLRKDAFFVSFTSGTTGVPKGAVHSNRSFLASQINTNMGPKNPGEKSLHWHPIGHISGTFIILHSLRMGKSIVLFPSSVTIDSLLEAVQRYRVNHLSVSANQAVQMVSTDYGQKYNLSSLIVLSHSGCKIASSVVRTIAERYRVLPLDSYAATEFFGSVGDRDFGTMMQQHFEPGNLGTVTPNVQMKVIDLQSGAGVALPPRQTGEVCFRGEACFVEYLNNKEATRATIDQDGWYHSGDVGYYDEGGNLFITDRIKEMIKYKLYSITPAEIEDFMHRHEAVLAVCVVGVPHITDGNLLRAYVQLVQNKSVTEQELIEYVKDNMGSQKRLRAGVHFIPEMPRTLIGKIDRQHFKRLVQHELLTEPAP